MGAKWCVSLSDVFSWYNNSNDIDKDSDNGNHDNNSNRNHNENNNASMESINGCSMTLSEVACPSNSGSMYGHDIMAV